jgi:phosphohistidine phosphatase
MELLVVRHGIAEEHAESGVDADRALTAEGRERVQRIAQRLVELELRVDRLLHSPWLRAVQTAQALAPIVKSSAAIAPCEDLARPPARALLAELRGDRLAVVGHEPWLSALVAWLAVGDMADSSGFEMRKASVAWLAGDPKPGGMALIALLPPRILLGARD